MNAAEKSYNQKTEISYPSQNSQVLNLISDNIRLRAQHVLDRLTGEDDSKKLQYESKLRELKSHFEGDIGAPYRRICRLFNLNESESALLQTCIAAKINPEFSELFGRIYGNGSHQYVTEWLTGLLYQIPPFGMIHASSPLKIWRFIEEHDTNPCDQPSLQVDLQIIRMLQGKFEVDPALSGLLDLLKLSEPLANWPVASSASEIKEALGRGKIVRVYVIAPPGGGQREFSGAVINKLGLQGFVVATNKIPTEVWHDVYVRANRFAVFTRSALVWTGNQAALPEPVNTLPAPLNFICLEQTSLPVETDEAHCIKVILPPLEIAQRSDLLMRKVPRAAMWHKEELDKIVSRYQINLSDIEYLSRRSPDSAEVCLDYCREIQRNRLRELGRPMATPFCWNDLILPERVKEALCDFAFEAKERNRFWELSRLNRLYPRGRGLAGLLTGPPGTGKTMAAQVIAADIDYDLYRIDVSAILSKYIGETAKNLSAVFQKAEWADAVLLFDEADALFSRRTDVKDAHDRYANTDTSYLLELVENHSGVILLATNRQNNIDPAFIRRIRYVFELPKPDPKAQQLIWQHVITEACGNDIWKSVEESIVKLSEQLELSGAQIKNSLLAAIFHAKRNNETIKTRHLLFGIERELLKEGRTLHSREKARIIGTKP